MLAKSLIAAVSETARPTRRGFLIGAAAVSGGFAVGFAPVGAATAQAAAAGLDPFAAYVTITADDRVIVRSAQFDMGQGSYHGVATLVAEELDADWATVEAVGAANDIPHYGNLAWGGFVQGTGGSTSMATSFDRYRKAGAAARAMLIAAAAKAWGVAPETVTTAAGVLSAPDGRSARFGEMAAAAAAETPPADPPLKARGDWTLIGSEALRRRDSASKARGAHAFTIDLQLPGLLTAVMIHPPRFGGKLTGFDATAARALPGVVDVVETPRGVAVVGEHMWAALKARDLVTATWDESAAEMRSSDAILAEYEALAAGEPAAIARAEGDLAAAFAGAATVLEATYAFPYLAHAAMEPLNAVAHRRADGVLEVWGGHQIPDVYLGAAAAASGLPPEQIEMHVMKTGGGFGRRAVGDADVIVEAVSVARALGWRAPVRVQWTREADMAGGRYRPAYAHRLRAGLDAGGRIVAWDNHIVGQSIVAGTPFAALAQNGVDGTSVEGASNLPYAIPALRVGLTTTTSAVPVLWWRAVGSTHTAYAVETMIDEAAAAAGADPVAYRLEMLAAHPRQAAVLRAAAEAIGWEAGAPAGRHRGVALHESFGTPVAQVVEISMENGLRVHRVVCAVDCGTAINPDTIRAQMEGGIGFGLGAILAEELTLTDGVVDQTNYDAYTPLRIDAMPQVDVVIVASDAAPTGVGEPGLPPIGPALANAVAAATGTRIRRLPFARSFA